jgi:hypothetical protein
MRIEIKSKNADSYLGHLLNEGYKKKIGKGFCINLSEMRYIPKEEMDKEGYGNIRFDLIMASVLLFPFLQVRLLFLCCSQAD